MTPTLESSGPEWTEVPWDRSLVDELTPEIPKCRFAESNVVSNNSSNTPPLGLTLYQSSQPMTTPQVFASLRRPGFRLSLSHSNVPSPFNSLSLSPCPGTRMTAPTSSPPPDPIPCRCRAITSLSHVTTCTPANYLHQYRHTQRLGFPQTQSVPCPRKLRVFIVSTPSP